jgi:hypothetical protein
VNPNVLRVVRWSLPALAAFAVAHWHMHELAVLILGLVVGHVCGLLYEFQRIEEESKARRQGANQ